mgnify:CR=1 FL=1
MQNLSLSTVGIDEVGYGCWAGPLFICAAKFKTFPDFELNDSKKLNETKRKELYSKLIKITNYNIGIASISQINENGLAKAYKIALQKAIEPFKNKEFAMDGKTRKDINASFYIKGDSKISIIAAASIIAKVERDNLMERLHQEFPEYFFNKNKGYGTKKHIEALKKHGFCKEHRTCYNLSKYL